MRVSIDCRYIRERPSGIGAYVRAIVDRVPSLAPSDSFHLWASPSATRPLSPYKNVDESVVRAPANSPATLWWPSSLVDLRGVDVLHEPFNLLGRGIACASVVTLHDLIWLLTPRASEGLSIATPFQVLFYRDGILRALRRARRLIAISQATADAIHLFAPEARPRVRVIPHGVEARFRPPESESAARERASLVLKTNDPYFLVVGQNAPFKNHEGILEGFAAADLGPRVRLVLLQRLYAKGPLLARARSLGIEDRLIWRTGLAEEDVIALMQGALALVQFSRYEGFGMPAAEAIACGTPVVASDIAPLVEVLGGAAVHVSLDPRQLGLALARVAREPSLRADLSGRGLERARALSWDRSAEAHLEVYREAASEGPLL